MKDIYKITWRDSSILNEQGSNDCEFEVSIIESVGFLLKEDSNRIVITRDLIDDDSRGVLIIPKENITSKKMLHLK